MAIVHCAWWIIFLCTWALYKIRKPRRMLRRNPSKHFFKFIQYRFIKCLLHAAAVAAAAAKSLQSYPTLCDPIDGSPPDSPIPGTLQARTLEWVAISFSNAWTWKVKVKSLSRVWLLATPWTVAHQAPLSMGFSRQEHWSGVPLPSPCYVLEVHKAILQSQWNNHRLTFHKYIL